MRNVLLVFSLLLLTISVFAQTLTIEPSEVHIEGSANNGIVEAHIMVTNTLGQEANLLWEKVVIDIPAEWQSQVCDKNLCYLPHVNRCPESMPSVLAPGESMEMRVDIIPGGFAGEGSITLHLFDLNDQENILGEIVASFSLGTTSTGDIATAEAVKIYPNPTTEYFQVTNSATVGKVQLFNIVGNQIKTQKLYGDDKIYVGDLPQGMYLVRLIAKNGNVIKTVRLSKR